MPSTPTPNIVSVACADQFGNSITVVNAGLFGRIYFAQAQPFQPGQWLNNVIVLPSGFTGTEYKNDWTFAIPTTLAFRSGTLPTGVTLSQTSSTEAKIDGTPTSAGTYTFTLRATIGFSYMDATYQVTITTAPSGGSGGMGGL